MASKTVYQVVKEISNLEELHCANVIRGKLLQHLSMYECFVTLLSQYRDLDGCKDPVMRARTDAADTFGVSEELIRYVIEKFNCVIN